MDSNLIQQFSRREFLQQFGTAMAGVSLSGIFSGNKGLDGIPAHERAEGNAIGAQALVPLVAGLGIRLGRGTNVSPLHIEKYRDVVGDGFDHLAKAGGAEIRAEGLEEGGVGLVGCRMRGCCDG